MIELRFEPKVRLVKNIVFIFASGTPIDVDIIESEGDSVDWDTHKDAFIIQLSERKASDKSFARPAMTMTILKHNLNSITRIDREEMERTPEQELLFKQTLQEMSSKAVN